jgi:hypothetical protein
MPRRRRKRAARVPLVTSLTSASRARLPPSPRLSARMMMLTYFTDTRMMIVQQTSDRMPNRFCGVTGSG